MRRKAADGGVDGIAFFLTGRNENAKIIFQAKSGSIQRKDIATLQSDMTREKAEMACLITFDEPTGPMKKEAKGFGLYHHEVMGRNYDRVSIVTAKQIVEGGARLNVPLSQEVLASAKRVSDTEQTSFL